MTEDKARKRSIRTRMAKTGESYTAARRHVVKSKEGPPTRLSVDLGKSDETIRRGSGKSWGEWFAILDAWVRRNTHTPRSHATCTRSTRCPVGGPKLSPSDTSAGAECEVSTNGQVDSM